MKILARVFESFYDTQRIDLLSPLSISKPLRTKSNFILIWLQGSDPIEIYSQQGCLLELFFKTDTFLLY